MTIIRQVFFAFAAVLISTCAVAQEPVTAQVTRGSLARSAVYEGHIEAVTQTSIAAQVAGVIEQIAVRAGDQVRAGQVLMQIDASQAKQQQAAMTAQVDAERAELHALTQELQRQKQLFARNYISKAALERVEAQQRAAAAQLKAQQAQAQAAQVNSDFFVIRAPYDGLVIDVPAMQGEMAMPGMPLLSLFNPKALRVSVAIPLAAAEQINLANKNTAALRILYQQRLLTVEQIQVLPTADRATHTVRLRIAVANPQGDLFPGQPVKVQLLQSTVVGQDQRLFIPKAAVIQRAELTAVYVLSGQHKALLRQVRLGVSDHEFVEVRSGLAEGEWVLLDHHAVSKE
ncbi:MAG: efflux RND transporter periplasmic adaptor subunit [Pseudomonas sp.]|nr:efflux RND transporter periplasmic adaptor subunit [Pseudomonas sp.]NLO53238.1 efflux RND transporter periplasmic adaptor subunit [Gammaproteobacteria bacterium]